MRVIHWQIPRHGRYLEEMAAEPINIFSCKIDPRGVVNVLRSLAPSLQVIGPEDCWEKIVIKCPRGWLRRCSVLTFLHNEEYYDGPSWPGQILGMQGYFGRFPETKLKPDILRLIGTFRFALATDFEPDRSLLENDDRLAYISAVARHLDGVIFTPSALHDPEGRILFGAGGKSDPEAVMPGMPPVSLEPSGGDGTPQDDSPEEATPMPPTPERVARRALALTAVTARALLEQDDPSLPAVKENWRHILDWVKSLGMDEEIEPDEWKVLQRPPGKLDQQATINATWRLEGLAVLAWALGLCELPPYDQLVAHRTLLGSLGILDVEIARSVITSPILRRADELQELNNQLFAFHWRVRNFWLHPGAMDFAKFAREAWFGPLDIRPLRLLDGDLAPGECPIIKAPRELVQKTLSSALERHLAINWLTGGGDIYSETDTST